MIKKLITVLLITLISVTCYASQFTDNYRLEIPAIGARNWQPIISNDLISTDTILGIMSRDIASVGGYWDKNATILNPKSGVTQVTITGALSVDTTTSISGDITTFGQYLYDDKYVVCDTFTSAGINAAIDALGAEGGEVYLPEGTYVCTDAVITIDADNTTLTGSGKGTILDFSAGQGTTTGCIDTNDKTNVTIQLLSMIGSESNSETTSLIGDDDAANNLIIQNCWFDSADLRTIWAGGARVLIDNCFFTNGGDDFIDIGGNYSSVTNCNFLTGSTYAIDSDGAYSTISNNIIRSVDFDGINTRGYTTITGNVIHQSGRDGIEVNDFAAVISGNTIYDTVTGYADIKLNASDKSVVVGNSCYGGGDSNLGIWLDGSDECVVSGNTTSAHDVAGIQEDSDCQDNLIYGNNCQDTVPYVSNGLDGIAFSTISKDTTATIGGQVGRMSLISGDGTVCYIPVYAGS